MWLFENGCPMSSRIVQGLVNRGFVQLAMWFQRRGVACTGPALAELGLHTQRQQELCRCFWLASKVCRTSPQLAEAFSAMAKIPWELQQHISKLSFGVR